MARRSLLSPHFTHRETGTKKQRESRDSASLATVLWPVPTEAQEPFQSGPGPTWRLSSTGPRPPEDLLAPRTPDSNPRDKQPGLGASAPSSIHQTTICLLSKSSTCHLSFLPPSMVPIHTHWGLEPQLGAWFLSTCAPPHTAWGFGERDRGLTGITGLAYRQGLLPPTLSSKAAGSASTPALAQAVTPPCPSQEHAPPLRVRGIQSEASHFYRQVPSTLAALGLLLADTGNVLAPPCPGGHLGRARGHPGAAGNSRL